MHSIAYDIDPTVKSRMLGIIESMFHEIEFLKITFSLRVEEEYASWKVHSFIATIWENLEDCMPNKLTGYGKMTPQEAEMLSDRIRVLLQMNEQLLEELRDTIRIDRSRA